MRIRLRAATPADAPLLRRWDEMPHVIASDPNDDWNWETELPRVVDWREMLIAEHEAHEGHEARREEGIHEEHEDVGGAGRPIGFMQIIDPAREESHYWGDVPAGLRAIDIWIGEPDALGQGYGTEMMRQALARCFAAPDVTAVIIDPLASNTRAHRFYERLGFRFVERRQFGEDDCFVFRLDRAHYAATQTASTS